MLRISIGFVKVLKNGRLTFFVELKYNLFFYFYPYRVITEHNIMYINVFLYISNLMVEINHLCFDIIHELKIILYLDFIKNLEYRKLNKYTFKLLYCSCWTWIEVKMIVIIPATMINLYFIKVRLKKFITHNKCVC